MRLSLGILGAACALGLAGSAKAATFYNFTETEPGPSVSASFPIPAKVLYPGDGLNLTVNFVSPEAVYLPADYGYFILSFPGGREHVLFTQGLILGAYLGAGMWDVTGVIQSYDFAIDRAPPANVSFTVDRGYFTVSSTPEPATWALLIAGFGGAGAVLRRSLRRNAVRI